jgi:hypothetical protein
MPANKARGMNKWNNLVPTKLIGLFTGQFYASGDGNATKKSTPKNRPGMKNLRYSE